MRPQLRRREVPARFVFSSTVPGTHNARPHTKSRAFTLPAG